MKRLNVEFTPAIRRLDIQTHHVVSTSVVGKYKSAFRGRGLEFESYREYVPELDDASMIDWKASLRANKELVKEYVEERNINVFFLVDTSSSMMYGTTKLLKSEYAANVAMSLSYAILQAGDSVGFGLFSEKVFLFKKPAHDMRQFFSFGHSLIKADNYGGKYNLSGALHFLEGFLPRKSVLIIISDFIGVHDKWEKSLGVAGKMYDLVGIMIRDPADEEFPESDKEVVLEDPYSQKQLVLNPDKIREDYRREANKFKANVRSAFTKARGGMIVLRSDEPYITAIQSFFRKRNIRYR